MGVPMYGPAFDDEGALVNRDVPEADVAAFMASGYVKGSLPEAAPAENNEADSTEEAKGKRRSKV